MSLKDRVIGGMLWSFLERFLAQIVSFVVSIVLARLLDPEHYGLIALILVFINIANVFATNSFGNALIQKEHADELDFSSVFYFNLVFSVLIYLLLFFLAPLLASFYNMMDLTAVFRVMGIRIIIASINSVQRAYVSRNLLFKRFFFSTLGGTIFSAVVGIGLAYNGFGVWALVAQYMTNTIIDTVILSLTVKWRPILSFSLERLKGLFSYGWKLLLSGLLATIYTEISELMIGKVYGSGDLAFFNRGKKLPQLFMTQVNSAIDTVLFPAMSKHQNQISKIKKDLSYSIRFGTFCIFPLLLGLAATSENFVIVLLTDKWIDSVIYVKLFCISFLAIPISIPNIQAIKAIGRSDIYLKLDVIKQFCSIIILFFCLKYGVVTIAIANVVFNLIGIIINVFPNKKLLDYSFFEQIKDFFPNLVLAGIMAVVVYAIGEILVLTPLLTLIVQISTGIFIYFGIAYLVKLPILQETINMGKSMLRKN